MIKVISSRLRALQIESHRTLPPTVPTSVSTVGVFDVNGKDIYILS